MDKERALAAALSQIEKNYGKGSVMKLGQRQEMNIEAIPTGSLGLDVALGIGGIPKGRIIEIFGPKNYFNAAYNCRSPEKRRNLCIY
jgi:recombination protein RecA